MSAPAALFVGRTVHVRHRPKRHAFSYRLFSLLLDVDRLAETAAASRLFAYNRFAPASFHDQDHGDGGPGRLRAWAEETLGAVGLSRPARIELLSFPRIFGYVFNPLSVWFCRDAADRLIGVIYEVHNTFGERHAYVAAIDPEMRRPLRHGADKRFHVSPFFGVDGRYAFKLRDPGDHFDLSISYDVDAERLFYAGWSARRVAFSDRALLARLLSHPLVTLKAIAAIHWEALWIWGKSEGYRAKPAAPHCAITPAIPMSFETPMTGR